MPVYNSAPFLKEAIESILNQTFTDFEFIILNDASTDNSRDIILSYQDSRIKFKDYHINQGHAAMANAGLELAIGRYIARMDSDDISTPDRLQKQFNYMEKHLDIIVCGGFFKAFGITNSILNFNWVNETDSEMVKINLLFDCAICQPTVMFRSDALLETGIKYDSAYDAAEDYRLWVSLAKNHKLANIPDHILNYRISGGNQTSNKKNHIQRSIKFDLIKEQLFDLGLDATDVELRIHDQMYYRDAIVSYDYLPKILAWIKKIIQANKANPVYNETKLELYLNTLYQQNEVSLKAKVHSLPLKPKVIFYIKKILRWKSIR